MVSLLEEETGVKWTVNKIKSEEILKLADEKMEKGDDSAIQDYVKVLGLRDGKGLARTVELANEVLGLPKDDLRGSIKAFLI